MDLKKSISLMLASTAISTAISGAVSACPGVEFAFSDRIVPYKVLVREDGELYPGLGVPGVIDLGNVRVDEQKEIVFALETVQGRQFELGVSGNDNWNDYTINLVRSDVPQGYSMQIAPQNNPNRPLTTKIWATATPNANAVNLLAAGQPVTAVLKITSNGSDLPKFINCRFNLIP